MSQKEVKIGAPSVDPKKHGAAGAANDLSEEDARIKAEVELLVTRAGDIEEGLVTVATNRMAELLKTAKGSAASVPKPLKFLRPHFDALVALAAKSKHAENSKTLNDILSFVSMSRESTIDMEREELREAERKQQAEKDEKHKPRGKAKDEGKSKSTKDEEELLAKAQAAAEAARKQRAIYIPLFECITYKLRGHPDDLAPWGYEYVRHLSGDLVRKVKQMEEEAAAAADDAEENKQEKQKTAAAAASSADGNARKELEDIAYARPYNKSDVLQGMAKRIMSYLVEHQDEPTACDFALELGSLQMVASLVDTNNVDKIVPYLLATAQYLRSEQELIHQICFDLLLRTQRHAPAMRLACTVNKAAWMEKTFTECRDDRVKTQLALMLGHFRASFHLSEEEQAATGKSHKFDEFGPHVDNEKLSEYFRTVSKALDNVAPRSPAEIFKEHVMDKHLVPQVANSHMHNLAMSFVSGLVNAGSGEDTLIGGNAGDSWIFQTKEHRQLSAVANVGLLHLWDHEDGINDVMRFQQHPDAAIRAGCALAIGVLTSGIRVPFDPMLALLSEHVAGENSREVRMAGIVGLALAYAGTAREDVRDLLIPLVVDGSAPVEIQCLAAYACGLIFVGTHNEDIIEAVTMCLMDKTEENLKDPTIRYLVLAMGLLVLRSKDRAEGLIEATRTLPPSIAQYAEVVVLGCAHCATGNVVIVQRLLALVAQKPPVEDAVEDEDAAKKDGGDGAAAAAAAAAEKKEKKKDGEVPLWSHKSAALIGVGLVALGEDIGMQLVKRAVHHVLLSKEVAATSGRRGLPLGLAMLNISNPEMPVIDTLSKLSHDSDAPTAQAAILGMGIASAGTNNARVATLLRNLSGYYHKDLSMLYIVRLAQGLTHMGKGMITLSPFKFDRAALSPVCIAGVLSFIHTAMDCEKTLLGDYHFMAFTLVPAMAPRMLLTVNDKVEKVDAQVRVGERVDTVAVAGKPKTITGFQTQQSPVLLQDGDRAELVPGKYQVVASGTVLEGIVVIEARKETAEDKALSADG